jgi:2'-5' RNA ligase
LTDLIGRLAARFGTPPFEPHVTLLGAMACDDRAACCARELAAGSAALELPVTGIGGGDPPFRILYLRLGETAPLGRLRAAAQAQCPHRESQPWFPHLSLLYGELEASARARIADELKPDLPASIRLDRLAFVDARGPVSAWRRAGATALTGTG